MLIFFGGYIFGLGVTLLSPPGLSVRENVTLVDPDPSGSTNSSSVAVAILVPFFALIFAGLGFYLYKQRYVRTEFSTPERSRVSTSRNSG